MQQERHQQASTMQIKELTPAQAEKETGNEVFKKGDFHKVASQQDMPATFVIVPAWLACTLHQLQLSILLKAAEHSPFSTVLCRHWSIIPKP
jgi:hypothetical protein